MRITGVDSFRVKVPPPAVPFVWRRGLPGTSGGGEAAVLRIRTDEGVEGVALAPRLGMGPVVEGLVDRVLREELLGQDPFQREFLWERIWTIDRMEEFPLPTLGLVDVALWDLAGRHFDVPTWQLLGGFRTSIPAYASTVTFASIEEYLDVADQCLELGYPAIKLHAWGGAREDAKLCSALREHVGDQVELMYDASAAFDLPDALYVGRALSDAGYLWYEEPLREFSINAHARLATHVSVPLLVAETSDGAHYNSADFIAAGAATFGVRTDTYLRAGFTGAMRTAHLADAFRVRAEVHGTDIPERHLCMAVGNNTYFESLITSNPVVRQPGVDADGMVHAPTLPGVALPFGLGYPDELLPYVTPEDQPGA